MTATHKIPVTDPPRHLYHAGTLAYTGTGLVMLFAWLLWGYFIYALMERVIPTLLPLLLKQHHATNGQISFITTSLNVIGNMVLNPIISFSSDRYRSRWGRRRPFIIWSTPLVALTLALIPFGPDIANYLQGIPAVKHILDLSPIVPGILFVSVFVMGFQIFDTFIASTYYYLVRDTVPEEVIGRFIGSFRFVGAFAPLFYNLFVFGHAETHMKLIFVATAALYGVGISLMCWRVKEGEFPPPEPLHGNVSNPWQRLIAVVRMYVGDCFRHPIYWWWFLAIGMAAWGGASGVFAVLFQRDELGINLQVQGRLAAAGSIVVLTTALPLGYLADKCNYFRIIQFSVVLQGAAMALAWFFVRDVTTLLVFTLCSMLANTGFNMAAAKAQVAIFPKEKFGQYGSANSAFSSLGMIGMSLLAAKFVDHMGNYRSYLLWTSAFALLSLPLLIWVEKYWRKLGGKDHYRAP